MTHPFLEAVARAMCCPRGGCGARTGTSVCLWTTYKPNALAAILALATQEPTQAMVEAANKALIEKATRPAVKKSIKQDQDWTMSFLRGALQEARAQAATPHITEQSEGE